MTTPHEPTSPTIVAPQVLLGHAWHVSPKRFPRFAPHRLLMSNRTIGYA
jgi:hypothetical protein